jgi:hypothetical protein
VDCTPDDNDNGGNDNGGSNGGGDSYSGDDLASTGGPPSAFAVGGLAAVAVGLTLLLAQALRRLRTLK